MAVNNISCTIRAFSYAEFRQCQQAGQAGISVSINGSSIQGSPFQATIRPGAAAAAQTFVSGPDAQGCIAALQCSFIINARDAYGNARPDGKDAFVASTAMGTILDVVSSGPGQGTYQASVAE